MIINGDGGYGLLAAYIGGPVAEADWLGPKVGGHSIARGCFPVFRLFHHSDSCSSQPWWLVVGSNGVAAQSRYRLRRFTARYCRSVARTK